MIESTLEEWKQRARDSDHVRSHETVVFNEGQDGVICAIIPHPNTSIFIGSYFTVDLRASSYGQATKAGTGWIHDDDDKVRKWMRELEEGFLEPVV